MPGKPRDSRIQAFISSLQRHQWPNTFNPWRQRDPMDRHYDAARRRRERLREHLSCPSPRLICLGEAPGYQGARFSGIPFTSERLLLEGAIPRISPLLDERISSRPAPWSEPSATVMWGAFYALGIAEAAVLWNAFAYHPHKPDNPYSNRPPTARERQRGLSLLEEFLGLYPDVPVVAVGRQAQDSLAALGVETACCVRHPAMGGAKAFREGLEAFVRSL